MNTQLNKKINKKQTTRKTDLNQILSEYYLKNYGEMSMECIDDMYNYMVYGEYISSYFRGYEVIRNIYTKKKILNFEPNGNIIKQSKQEKAKYFKKMFASYEFKSPLHPEVLKEISLKVKGYKFLYMYIENDYNFDFANRIDQSIFEFLLECKTYFLFKTKTLTYYANNKGNDYVFEYLFCIDLEDSKQSKLKLKNLLEKNLTDSELSIDYLKSSKLLLNYVNDSVAFFDRSKFYSNIDLNKFNIFLMIHVYTDFIFFDYKEELSDFFKLGIHLKAMREVDNVYMKIETIVIGSCFNRNGYEYQKEKQQHFNLSRFDGLRLLPNFENIEEDYVFIYSE